METIEVHSKDFVIRWVEVDTTSKVTWKTHPIKRSINFGVFSHNEDLASGRSFADSTGNLTERLHASGFESMTGGLRRVEARENAEGSVKIERKALVAFVFDNTFSISNSKHVQFSFNIEPLSPSAVINRDRDMHVTSNNEGCSSVAAAAAAAALYAKHDPPHALSATAPFPQLKSANHNDATTPSASSTSRKLSLSRAKSPDRPRSRSIRRNTLQNGGSIGPHTQLGEDDEATSVRKHRRLHNVNSFSSLSDGEVMKSLDGRYVTGFLQKKRRKNFQGFARRYFALDKQTGLLNYYLSNKSSSLRGVMPIKIAELKSDSQTLQFTLNSGMEKWTLKANDANIFASWCSELKEVRSMGAQDESELESEDDMAPSKLSAGRAVKTSNNGDTRSTDSNSNGSDSDLPHLDASLATDVPALQSLRSFIASLPLTQESKALQGHYADIVKQLLKKHSKNTTTSKAVSQQRPSAKSRLSQATIKPLMHRQNLARRRLRRLYNQIGSRNFLCLCIVGVFMGVILGANYSVAFVVALLCAAGGGFARFETGEKTKSVSNPEEMSFVEAYSTYNLNNRSSQSVGSSLATSGGASLGSDDDDDDDDDDDFSDASDEEDRTSTTPVTYVPQKPLRANTEEGQVRSEVDVSLHGDGSSEHHQPNGNIAVVKSSSEEARLSAETSLYPLPHEVVKRRNIIKGPVQQPPSLLAMLRKAKDPANMTAPITSNEPLSGVQIAAEMYENSDLLDEASRLPPKSNLRIMHVAVFAVARLSNTRVKERVLRKPFTPLLGETFEMVREDRGFRFVAEKVTHKPEVVATQAESELWTVHFTSRPHTKMWAKSIQLTDVGDFSVTFPDGESISFMNPELFIRNILAGERYVEPSGTVTVESSAGPNLTATIEFKSGGMFSGRSEDVRITSGKLTYEGKWTESISDGTKQIWAVKPLVDAPTKHYGWPEFTAQLNEITPIENKSLPPNDSRLRPDLRLYEDQEDIESAEKLKLALEQRQRERRKEMEVAGKQHEPFFFVKSKDSKGHYILRRGNRNYWVLRQKNDWNSIPLYFEENHS